MALASTRLLDALRAIGEETRLRIIALLQHGELTVTDLTSVLGQSQPRISRHLKLLADAGIVERHREGSFVFFDLVTNDEIGQLVRDVLSELDPDDTLITTDRSRLTLARQRRAESADAYFARIAAQWDEERSLHGSELNVEATLLTLVGDQRFDSIIDIGTGTGRILQLLAPQAHHAVGLDSSPSMLAVARANLERAEVNKLTNVDLRQGDAYRPPFEPSSFDLVIVHQVLHYLDDPALAVAEAAQLIRPGGRLLIVDFASHALDELRDEHNHRRLGFRPDLVAGWMERAGLDVAPVHTIPPAARSEAGLTVLIWDGHKTSNTPGVPATSQTAATPRSTTSRSTTSQSSATSQKVQLV